MNRLLRSQKGQALVELALVVFIFTLFALGIVQLIWLGSAHIKCHQAARRAAWITGAANHAELPNAKKHIQAILPGCDLEYSSGNQERGKKVTVHYKVPAIGPFRVLGKTNFNISASSAVISYNEKPVVTDLIGQGIQAVWDAVSGN